MQPRKIPRAGTGARFVAAAAVPLAMLAGCESSGLSAREAGNRNFSSYVYSLYAAPPPPELAGASEPARLALPTKLGVAQVGEVAPPETVLDKLRGKAHLFARVEAVPGTFGIDPYEYRQGDATFTPEEVARKEMDRMREYARSMGMDHLLLIGGTIDHAAQDNGLSVLDLTIVGAFVVPSKQITAEAKASGALIDLKTGRVVLTASADASEGGVASTVTQESGQLNVARKARDEVLGQLAAQVIERCQRWQQATAAAF
jgi:hypothetical protein